MKEETQRIAIAEACPELMKGGYYANGIPMRHIGGDRFEPFDPINDLNVMHEVEATLFRRDFYQYVNNLKDICSPDGGYNGNEGHEVWATAKQKAKAFLITSRLWIEE